MITKILLSIEAMKINNQLFKKVELLAELVKKDFKTKGLVIPIKESDGSVKFNDYSIVRTKSGFYSILYKSKITIVDYINLPQSAIIVANSLALGKGTDDRIISYDKQYGFSSFEEDQCTTIAASMIKKKDWERLDTIIIKKNIASHRSQVSKETILKSFEKFLRLR